MNLDLREMNMEYEASAGASSSRNVVLDIDTDIVLESLANMASVLDDNQKKLLSGFDLAGAWSSTNASTVIAKVGEINASFTTMQTIIESLQTKVNSYVQNTIDADKVTFNGGEEGSTGTAPQGE